MNNQQVFELYQGGVRDFRHIDFGEHISLNLNEVDLSESLLSYITLYKTELNQSKLVGAVLSYASMQEVYLHDSDASSANFIEAFLTEVYFPEATLTYTNFSRARVIQSSFRGQTYRVQFCRKLFWEV